MDPAAFLGLQIGDAHVIWNAGGRATEDAIRSLLISSWLLGTQEFAVIHHTDCGMTKFTDPVLRDMIRDQAGVEVDMEFLSFGDPDQSARDDVDADPRDQRVPGRRDGVGARLRRADRSAARGGGPERARVTHALRVLRGRPRSGW